MPIIDPGLIARARSAIEKRAGPVIIPVPLGGMIGAGIGTVRAPRGHRTEGAARGGLHGLAIDAGMGLGGGLGLLGGSAVGGQYGNPLAWTALGGLGGAALGGLGGHLMARGGLGRPSWDRELPHGISGADDEDEDGGRRKAASFAFRMGELAARARK